MEVINQEIENLDKNNKEFYQAIELVKYTDQFLFLTGKAGTGKTTFLKYLKEVLNKKTVIIAYTGIAAINAGGQTIHSFFKIDPNSPPFLPNDKRLRTFVPKEDSDKTDIYNNFTYSKTRKEILKSIDVLIIDEVSMLRADFLDAIDSILRTFSEKNKSLPFGGVQVVLIGDAFQLQPIEGKEWKILEEFYDSPFFFSSKVMLQHPPIIIELLKIYRQNEESEKKFIEILNRIRINETTTQDIAELNSKLQVITDKQYDENNIVLCSTNYQVNEINANRLDTLEGDVKIFTGDITGYFPDNSKITETELKLKNGAQIIFIKNGDDYYNGMIGKIESIDENDITASTINNNGVKSIFKIKKFTWINYKYTFNRAKYKIEQEELGTYTQYPIKLAWAITIHKSQGLTFNKVIVDINNFAPAGLVYVALSRCTTLDGLILKTQLQRSTINTDKKVIEFAKTITPEEPVLELIKKGKIDNLKKIKEEQIFVPYRRKNGKCIFVDLVTLKPLNEFAEYDHANIFLNGYANVCNNEKYGAIDIDGNEHWIYWEYNEYGDESEYRNNILRNVVYNGKKGVVNKYFKEVTPLHFFHSPKILKKFVAADTEYYKFLIYHLDSISCSSISNNIYDDVREINDNYLGVSQNRLWGVINENGEQVVECIYDNIYINLNFITLTKRNNILIINVITNVYTTKIIPDVSFDFVETLNDEISILISRNKLSYISNKDFILELGIYENIFVQEGLIIVLGNYGNFGILDVKGKEIAQCIYDHSTLMRQNNRSNLKIVHEDLISIPLKGKWGCIDFKGNIVIPFEYTFQPLFKNGYARVHNNSWGLLNKEGVIVIDCLYNELKKINCNLITIENIDKKWAIFNIDSGIITDFIYTKIESTDYDYIYAKIKNVGLLNKEGVEVVPLNYNEVEIINSSVIKVKTLENKWGIINTKENNNTLFIYDEIEAILDNKKNIKYFLVKKNNKWGVLNKKYKLIEIFKYDSIEIFKCDATVKINKKWGLLDDYGKLTYSKLYKTIEMTNSDNLYLVTSEEVNQKKFYINVNGTEYKD